MNIDMDIRIILTLILVIYVVSIYPAYWFAVNIFEDIFFKLLDNSLFTDDELLRLKRHQRKTSIEVSLTPFVNTIIFIIFMFIPLQDIYSLSVKKLKYEDMNSRAKEILEKS